MERWNLRREVKARGVLRQRAEGDPLRPVHDETAAGLKLPPVRVPPLRRRAAQEGARDLSGTGKAVMKGGNGTGADRGLEKTRILRPGAEQPSGRSRPARPRPFLQPPGHPFIGIGGYERKGALRRKKI